MKYMTDMAIKFMVMLFLSGFIAGRPAYAEVQDSEITETVSETSEEEEAALAEQAELEEIRREAEDAKAAAERARIEKEKARQEEEALKKAIELEKARLELEKKETEISRQEARTAAITPADRRAAAERLRQEQREDREAQERIRLAEEKMLVSQRRAKLAEEEMRLAKERLTMATERLRVREGRPNIVANLIESMVVLLVGLLLLLVLKRGVRKLEKMLTKQDVIRESDTTLQIKTVAKLFNWLGTIVIIIVILYVVLEKHGLDMAPLLAGAGIMGLAFGFGGQYLIRDLINGLFILLEGQFRVNDVVKIGEYGGLVEDINLRITTLRDLEGRVIIIPNGEIKTVVNFTKEYSQALLDIGVAYKENVDRVMEVIKETGREMREDPYFKRIIIGDLEMLGVDSFSDSAVIIRFRMKTMPIKQWEVMREFRRRIKNRFDELNIEIPFPHRTMYWGVGKYNDWMRGLAEDKKGE